MSNISTDDRIKKLMRILRSKRIKNKVSPEEEDDDDNNAAEDDAEEEKSDDSSISARLMARMRAGASGVLSASDQFFAQFNPDLGDDSPVPSRPAQRPPSRPAAAPVARAAPPRSQQSGWDSFDSFFSQLNHDLD